MWCAFVGVGHFCPGNYSHTPPPQKKGGPRRRAVSVPPLWDLLLGFSEGLYYSLQFLMTTARDADLLLCFDEAVVYHVEGTTRTPVDNGPFLLFSMECDALEQPLAVPQAQAASSTLTFAICSSHKVPVSKAIPVRKTEPRFYAFVLPGYVLGFQFAEDFVSDEELDALDRVLETLSRFEVGAPEPETVHKKTDTSATAPAPPLAPVSPEQEAVAATPASEPAASTTEDSKLLSGAQTYAAAVSAGGSMLATGIDKGAGVVNGLVRKGSEMAKQRLVPEDASAEIAPGLQTTLRTCRQATALTCSVSGALAKSLVGISTSLAGVIADSVSSRAPEVAGSATLQAAGLVVGSTLVAGGEVLEQLTTAGADVIKTVGHEAAEVVQHKYGEEAGKAAKEGAQIVHNSYRTAVNVKTVTRPSKLLKSTAKETGKQTVLQLMTQEEAARDDAAASGPPLKAASDEAAEAAGTDGMGPSQALPRLQEPDSGSEVEAGSGPQSPADGPNSSPKGGAGPAL